MNMSIMYIETQRHNAVNLLVAVEQVSGYSQGPENLETGEWIFSRPGKPGHPLIWHGENPEKMRVHVTLVSMLG